MSNISDIQSLIKFLLTGNYIRSIYLQFKTALKQVQKFLIVTSNFEVLLGVTGFTLWVRPIFVTSQRHFSPQNTLQLSQIQVSPVDPNMKHLLLKYQAVWLCCLGEIIHQFDFGAKAHHGCHCCPTWNHLSSHSQHLNVCCFGLNS